MLVELTNISFCFNENFKTSFNVTVDKDVFKHISLRFLNFNFELNKTSINFSAYFKLTNNTKGGKNYYIF